MLHQVGAGTLGPVFRAHDPAEGRLVAIKAFHLDLVPERQEHFASALRLLAERNLEHPAIAAPLAAGIEGGTPWLAQTYVPAESLDAALRQYGPPPLGDALGIVTALAGALDFAAAVGVFHGALHPRDVLVAPDDTRLVDLGVAAALEDVGLFAPIRRPYAAPERVAGAPVSRASDVFSLGAITFELVTGRRVAGAGDAAVAALPVLHGANHEALVDTFAFALSAAPDERFTTALGFVAALKRALGEAQLGAVPTASIPPAVALDLATANEQGGGGAAAVQEASPDTVREETPVPDAVLRVPATPAEEEPPSLAEPLMEVEPPIPSAPPKSRPRAPKHRARTRSDEAGPPLLDHPPAAVVPETAEPAAVTGIDDVELRPRAQDPGDWAPDGAAADGAADLTPRVPRPAPEPARRRFPLAPIAAIFVVSGLAGIVLGWLLFGRGPAVPAHDPAGEPVSAPAAAPAAETPAPAPAATPPAAAEPSRGSGAAQVAGPTAPAPTPAGQEPVAAPQKTPAPAASTRPAVARGALVVRSTPPGARVQLNGRSRGRTPLTVRDLPLGGIRVRLTRDGYKAVERHVTLIADKPSQAIDVPLEKVAPAPPPAPAATRRTTAGATEFVGTLFFETRPTGARVYLDGKAVGSTPLELKGIRAGSHVVRFDLARHKRWSASVQVVAGERNRVAASLEEEEGR